VDARYFADGSGQRSRKAGHIVQHQLSVTLGDELDQGFHRWRGKGAKDAGQTGILTEGGVNYPSLFSWWRRNPDELVALGDYLHAQRWAINHGISDLVASGPHCVGDAESRVNVAMTRRQRENYPHIQG
jgi:hypothetical protein